MRARNAAPLMVGLVEGGRLVVSILDDRPLERSAIESTLPQGQKPRSDMVRLGLALAAILLIVAGVFVARRWFQPAQSPDTLRPPTVDTARAPASSPAAVDLPPPAQMDAFIRTLLGGLSTAPELARWLTTDDLTSHIASAIDQFSRGLSPARDAKIIAPSAPFHVSTRGGRTYIAPESYARYDSLANAAASMDAGAVARAYTTLKPRLAETYRLLGNRDGDLDAAVESAIVTLLEVPIVTEPIAVVPGRGNLYAYADPRLESLKPAQKQLLRMGPENVRAVQAQLRALAQQLGIPSSRLPAPR